MAWQKVIVGYKIVGVSLGAEVPVDWIFLCVIQTAYYTRDLYVFKRPIYKKRNIKKGQ